MHGFQPAKHKAKPKNYANGGIVKGPGTGTSDEVPAMVPEDGYIMPADSTQALGFKPGMRPAKVSNGEMVLNGEQVQQAGGFQALEAMKQATHTPVPEHGVDQPQFFFANGGATDEERRRMLAQIPNSAPPGWAGGTGERVSGNDFTRNVSNTVNALAPVSGAAAPIVAGVARGFAGGAKAAAASPMVEKVASYGIPAAGFGALATAANNEQPTAPPVARPQENPVAKPAARPMASGLPEVPGTPAAQSNSQAPTPTAGNVNVRRQSNGVMEFSGENVAGDVSYNGAAVAGFKPSGAGVSVVPASPVAAGFQPTEVAPAAPPASQNLTPADTGQGTGYGLLNSNRIAIRNAMIDVKQGDAGAQDVLRGLIGQQAAAPGQQIEREKLAADTASSEADRALKAGEQNIERGFRAGQLANDAARTALDAKKVGSDLEVRGFEVGQAKRLENLRAKYDAATDPKVKAELAQQLRTLSGKDEQANRFTVVPGGQEYDTTAQVMRIVPARVLNNQTGQFVDGAGAGKALPPLKDNTAAMAVVNDVSLSKEQRAAKLRELGYN